MTSTENYKLTKFSETEYYNVNFFNDNMDKVDAAIKEAYTITPEGSIYEVDISKVGSGNNILYITIPDVISYDDLNGKSVKLYTGIYSNNANQTVYVNINGLGARAIRRVTTDSSYETSTYAPYEINRHMVMELYISGTSVFWVNPACAIASTDTYGVVKVGSGLYQSSNGYLTVNVGGENYGVRKSGDGKIITVPATEADIDAKTNSYKVITPANLEYAVASTEAVDHLCTYSIAPQRVGTWVDGTPIWRIAFQREITELERQDRSISVDLNVMDLSKASILSEHLWIYMGEPELVDDIRIPYYHGGLWDIPANIHLDTYTGTWGWVEFITPESNIQTT